MAITAQQQQFLIEAFNAAKEADHPWPRAAAAEACTETGWGAHVPHGSNNILGIKAGRGYKGKVVTADGTEQMHDGSFTAPEEMIWRVYDSYAACFRDQVHILHTQKDATGNLAYRKALAAPTEQDYILEEAKVWSTGILKGQMVLRVYLQHAARIS